MTQLPPPSTLRPARPPRPGQFARMVRVVLTASSFLRGEPSLQTILASGAAVGGVGTFAVLLAILQRNATGSRQVLHHGLTVTEWGLVGLDAVAIVVVAMVTQAALTTRIITLLQGEPLGVARCWLQALRYFPRLVLLGARRLLVGLTTSPQRRDRRPGGLGYLIGPRAATAARQRVALAGVLFDTEQVPLRQVGGRSLELMADAGGPRACFDPPLARANALGTCALALVSLVLGISWALLGVVVALLGALVLFLVAGAGAAAFTSGLYFYVADEAATLGFSAEDLHSSVERVKR